MCEINTSCICNDSYDLELKISETNNNPAAQPDSIHIDFGEVYVGQRKSLYVPIRNTDDKIRFYTVRRNAAISIYQFFKTTTEMFQLRPEETINVRITYKPVVPNQINTDYYSVQKTSLNNYNEVRIVVTGKAIGPTVQVSTDILMFNTWPSSPCSKKAIEIRNLSVFPVDFKFDVDDKPQPIFGVVPQTGTIPANRHVIVNVTFRVTSFGEYSQRLFCLVHNHEPLLVDLFGVYSKARDTTFGQQIWLYPDKLDNNFSRYMRDVQTIVKVKPPFSFNDTYLNFGTLNSKVMKESTLMTSLTNHQNRTVVLKWHPDEYFKMTPTKISIPANESVLFECIFRPALTDSMYSRNLVCNIYDPEEKSQMPIAATLRVLGHSFSDQNVWIPQFEVEPATVVLPPVLPGESSFATIDIKTKGYLPTSFVLVPPTVSNFLAKPLMDIVRDVNVIIVQLVSLNLPHPKVYVERWHVMLNNEKNHMIPICFKGYAALPSLVIGQDNTITITGVQVGCEETIFVKVRNTSQHQIHYEFLKYELPDNVKIQQPSDNLSPNASHMLQISFKSESRICKQFEVTCLVYVISNLRQIDGPPVEIPVTINLESAYSNLCSLPSTHDFGPVECRTIQTTNFSLFNYGHSTLHFVLSIWHDKTNTLYKNATITPISGTIAPKSNLPCCLSFRHCDKEKLVVNVSYELRVAAESKEIIADTFRTVFVFTADVVVPSFQVLDIADHNFGPLFCKRTLWEMLNLSWLNYALAEAKCGETTTCIDLTLPDVEMNGENFYVTLMAQNVTQFPVQVSLKRRKLCDCDLQEVNQYVSIRKKVYQCPHRRMLKVSINEKTILPNLVESLMLHVNYCHLGETTLSYTVNLSDKKSVVLNFHVRSIAFDESWLSIYSPTFALFMFPVGLSEKDPSVQAFWVYNNTNIPSTYNLDVSGFENINKEHNFEIFKCLNPKGVVNGYSAIPLLFKFRPLQRKQIDLRLPLMISNQQEYLFYIQAHGKRAPFYQARKPFRPKYVNTRIVARLSMDRMLFGPYPVWSYVTRMIFLSNLSDDILGYNWIKNELLNICIVNASPSNGILRPKQSQSVIIQVKTFGVPCVTRLLLTCELISHTKYLQHKKSLHDYKKRDMEIRDEFVITEKGTFYPINHVDILPRPNYFHVTVALELEITSYVDRDIHHNPDIQLLHEPQNVWPLSIESLSVPNGESIPSTESKQCLCTHDSLPQTTSSSSYNDDLYVEKTINYELDPKEDNFDFYRDVIEALIADAVFSKLFKEIMNVQKLTSIYNYTQIRPRKDVPTDLNKYIYDMNNEPQMPFMKEILHEMLVKGIHSNFELSPELKLVDIDYKTVDLPNMCTCEDKPCCCQYN